MLGKGDQAIAQSNRLRLSTAALGSSPKHTIYAFIMFSQICAISIKRKEKK